MANNPYVNKVVYGDQTLIDLTGDSVVADKLLEGYTAHDASGRQIVGTAVAGGGSAVTVVDTQDAAGGTIREITAVSLAGDTVAPSNLLTGYTAHNALGQPIVGTASGGGSATLQTKTATPSETAQTITADSGYDGLDTVEIEAISATYIGSEVPTQAAQTIYPATTDTTIAAGTYIEGAQTIKAVATSGISAATIKAGIVAKVGDSANAGRILSVTGSYAGVGTVDGMQAYIGYGSVKTTSYTDTGVTLTVAETGTYTVSWVGWRSNSGGTSGSRLYINGTAYGSAVTAFTTTYGQEVTLTGVSLNAGDVLSVRARSRTTSYYMSAANLIITKET